MNNLLIKLYLLLLFCLVIYGFFFRYNWLLWLSCYFERKRMIEFASTVHAAVIKADIGKGKTLLLSILARHLPEGIKKVGFVSNIPDVELLSYSDINFDEKIPINEASRLRKYFFLDETNFWIEGVNVKHNRDYHAGVADLLQISRHHGIRLWISATRGNHVWIAMREMVNYYVVLGGVKKLLTTLNGTKYYTLRITFYTQSWDLENSFNILVSDLDFDLYETKWLQDTAYWRIDDKEKVPSKKH